MDTVTLTRAQVEELRAIIHNAESPLGNRLQDVSSRLYFALDGAGWIPRPGHAALPIDFKQATDQGGWTVAARDVMAERQRQISTEGWTPAHDDEHANGSMAIAAACYALADVNRARPGALSPLFLWRFTGWAESWWKPKSRRSNLVRSGALILAEIERLDRAAAPTLLGVADGDAE